MKKTLRNILITCGIMVLMSTSGILLAQDSTDKSTPDQGSRQGRHRDANGGDRGDRADRMKGFDPARMQDMMLDHMKTRLNATDEEWTVIKPLMAEVMKLRMKNVMGMAGGFRGMRPPREGEDRQGGEGRQDRGSSFMKDQNPEAAALLAVTGSETSSNDEIKAKLKAYRESVKKDDAALKTARENLRKVLNLRQEATLVVMGMLD